MTMRDYRSYSERCVSCGRSSSVQYHGERCARCVAQAEGDTQGCAVCAVVGTDTHRKPSMPIGGNHNAYGWEEVTCEDTGGM